MTIFSLAAMLASAVSEPCALPESMPQPSAMMAGEGDADWCLDGADPFVAAGPDLKPFRQLVWEREEPWHTVVTQWRRIAPDAPPAHWRKVFTRPAKVVLETGGLTEVLFQRLGDNLIVVTVNPAWRIGNAVCVGEGGESTGYLPEGVAPTEADQAGIEQMTGWESDMDPGNVMCVQLHPEGDVFTGSFRGPQGRPLPEIDDAYAATRLRAVAPGDIERWLAFNR